MQFEGGSSRPPASPSFPTLVPNTHTTPTTSPLSRPFSALHRASTTVARKTALRQVTCAPSSERIHPSPLQVVVVVVASLASIRCPYLPSGCSRCSGCGFETRRGYRLDSAGERRSRRRWGRKARVGVGVGCVRCGYKRGANLCTTFATRRENEGRPIMMQCQKKRCGGEWWEAFTKRPAKLLRHGQ